MLAMLAGAASAQTIYRYRTPDGRTIFTDRPVPGAVLEEELQRAAQPDPAAVAAQRAAARERAREASDRAADRIAALQSVDQEIRAATVALQQARAALDAGREPLPGERTGVAAEGRSRLNESYWARQADNEERVLEAEARLERARRAMIDLR
jgi:hypothetical protein